jgi:hypothetical protein
VEDAATVAVGGMPANTEAAYRWCSVLRRMIEQRRHRVASYVLEAKRYEQTDDGECGAVVSNRAWGRQTRCPKVAAVK